MKIKLDEDQAVLLIFIGAISFTLNIIIIGTLIAQKILE